MIKEFNFKRNNLYNVKGKAFLDMPDIKKAKALITEIWEGYLRLCVLVDNLKFFKEMLLLILSIQVGI